MVLLELQSVGKTYETAGGEVEVLKNISFSISAGEFVSIMGPSGSGKSTLLHIVGFLDKETAGYYSFKGRTSEEYGEDDLAKIRNQEMGFVFQAFNLLPRESVYENIKLPLTYSKLPEHKWDQKIKASVEAVGLTHRLNYEAYKLSGGERQRVAIARALVNDPAVIFADEPTGNLDSKSGQAVMRVLQELNEKHGHTVILITHETSTAEHARRMLKLHDGELVADEPIPDPRRAEVAYEK